MKKNILKRVYAVIFALLLLSAIPMAVSAEFVLPGGGMVTIGGVNKNIYFITGHGEELIDGATGDEIGLYGFFRNEYYGVRRLDLNDTQFECNNGCGYSWGYQTDIIPARDGSMFLCHGCNTVYTKDEIMAQKENAPKRQIPSDADVIVINAPTSDFSISEIIELERFVKVKGKLLMCFFDPSVDSGTQAILANLYNFISANTGVTILGEHYIHGPDTSATDDNAVNTSVSIGSTSDPGFIFLKNELGFCSPWVTNSGILEIDPSFLSSTGYSTPSSTMYTSPLLKTDAMTYYNGLMGEHTVMSITAIKTSSQDQSNTSYITVCPSKLVPTSEDSAAEKLFDGILSDWQNKVVVINPSINNPTILYPSTGDIGGSVTIIGGSETLPFSLSDLELDISILQSLFGIETPFYYYLLIMIPFAAIISVIGVVVWRKRR